MALRAAVLMRPALFIQPAIKTVGEFCGKKPSDGRGENWKGRLYGFHTLGIQASMEPPSGSARSKTFVFAVDNDRRMHEPKVNIARARGDEKRRIDVLYAVAGMDMTENVEAKPR